MPGPAGESIARFGVAGGPGTGLALAVVMRLLLVISCLALSGCIVFDDGAGEGDDDDGSPAPPDAGPADRPDAAPEDRFDCDPDDAEETHPVSVAGTVIDHATGDPIAGAEVAVGSAWHLGGGFPQECPPIATLTTSSDGRFGPAMVDVRSPSFSPPYVIFMVTGEGVAPTASDQAMDCIDAECSPIEDHVVAAPTEELATQWRQELERGGVPDAATRGLVLFAFTNLDGSPAEDVVLWQGLFETDALDPDEEVRFLAADRITLAPTGVIATTESGLALLGVGSEEPDQGDGTFIYGTRVADQWEVLGALHDPGWIFVEDNQQER